MKLRTKDWEVIGASLAMATVGGVLWYLAHKRDAAASPFATHGYWPFVGAPGLPAPGTMPMQHAQHARAIPTQHGARPGADFPRQSTPHWQPV